ncbi:nucleotide exchange factor GrpE [Spirulina subsalsa]|uniref:nucleotide exchange factor GrpE n=1 Tax=Spirulina subsalsa TaxID=54311 RepID=UPI0002D44259|nr:nucleotide exchange factor GrpE [Spirulina subsalsa]
MVDDPNLFWFGVVLWFGGTLALLTVVGSRMAREENLDCVYPGDELLRDRLLRANLSSWTALQRKAGLTPRELEQLRQGSIEKLELQQLQRLATTLNWTLEELLQQFGISFPSLGVAFQEIGKLHQKCQSLYDETVMLKGQLATAEEGLATAQAQVAQLEEQTTAQDQTLNEANYQVQQLQQQCRRMRAELQQGTEQIRGDIKTEVFEQLQTLLMNFPTACTMAEAKPNLPAKNLIALFTPLKNLLQTWGYEPIGSAWEQVIFDPQIHQGDRNDIQAGDLVYIRFVGYREGDRILCPAKVSRTLPKT